MKKYTNESGKPAYSEVTNSTLFDTLEFHGVDMPSEDDHQVAMHTNLGSLTVLRRMTGYGFSDVETGYRDADGKFWLASGNCDVRTSNAETIGEAIEWVKRWSNTCIGVSR